MRRLLPVLAFIAGALWALVPALPAQASATGTFTPSTVSANGERVHVSWAGMTPGSFVYIDQCDNVEVSKPGAFDYGVDCSKLTEEALDGRTYNASGSGATGGNGAVEQDFKVFTGAEPSGVLGWGCGAGGTPEGVQVGGTLMFNPCLIRVADGAPNAPINVVFMKLTIRAAGPSVRPAIAVSPSPAVFPGTTPVGSTSAALTVTARAAGTVGPTILAVDPSGLETFDFHFDASACNGATLSPGGPGCKVAITFQPTKAGTHTVTVLWYDTIPSDPALVLDVTATATGPPPVATVAGASDTAGAAPGAGAGSSSAPKGSSAVAGSGSTATVPPGNTSAARGTAVAAAHRGSRRFWLVGAAAVVLVVAAGGTALRLRAQKW